MRVKQLSSFNNQYTAVVHKSFDCLNQCCVTTTLTLTMIIIVTIIIHDAHTKYTQLYYA